MAQFKIDKPVDISVDAAIEALNGEFGGRYEIYPTKLLGADLIIKKTGWTGVSVRFMKKKDKTLVRYAAMSPSAGVRMLGLGLIPILILWATTWKKMQAEIGAFIEQSPVFRGEAPAPAAAPGGLDVRVVP